MRGVLSRSASLTALVAVLLAAGGGGAGATVQTAVMPYDFDVCSPLSCDRQFVIGNAGKWGSAEAVRIEATGVNQSTVSELLVRMELVDADGTITPGPHFSVDRPESVPAPDQQTRTIDETIQGTFVELRVSACAVPPGTCNTETYPLETA
jgi:hypothetical protein